MNILDKIGLITGGLEPSGVALTKEFLRKGLKGMAVLEFNKSKNIVAQQLLSEFGSDRVIIIYVDLRNKTELESAFKTAIKKFHRLDIVINNGTIYDFEDRAWEKGVAINYIAPYHLGSMFVKKYLPSCKLGDSALIINMSSLFALTPLPFGVTFCSTKAALMSMGRVLATNSYFDKYRTKFLTICPGVTVTSGIDELTKNEDMQKILKPFGSQTYDQLATMVVKIVRNFENGNVFICQNNKYFKVDFADKISADLEYY